MIGETQTLSTVCCKARFTEEQKQNIKREAASEEDEVFVAKSFSQ